MSFARGERVPKARRGKMNEIGIMATRSMKEFSERVARYTKAMMEESYPRTEILLDLSLMKFADGEMEAAIGSSVRGKDIFLFALASRNAMGLSVEENKLELYHAIDALKRAKAGRITVIEPYVSCSRSDRANRRNSVGLWIHFKILSSLGADQVITCQLHSDKSKSMIDPVLCQFDDIPAAMLLKKYICDQYVRNISTLKDEVQKNWVFCCVDSGGEKLATRFSEAFGTELIIAHKQRDYSKANTVESVSILSSTPVEGKQVWIVDDMIDTGGSVYVLVKELARRGVKGIRIATVHPLFSEPAITRLKSLCDEGLISALLVCDTIPCPDSIREELPCIEVVSSAELFASVIVSIHNEGSLSRYFGSFNAEEYLSTQKFFF
jgi:ribose-phosphate pyrophosphokinase